MPADLSADGTLARLRNSLAAVKAERDELREQVSVLPGLYDELRDREDQIIRLEARGNTDYHAALERIVAAGGRGGLRIAQDALQS